MSNNDFNENYSARLESLFDLAQILCQQSDFEEVLRLVVEKASTLINSSSTLIMMVNPQTRNTIKTIFAGKSISNEQNHFIHTNVSGWVLINNSSFLSNDIKSDNRFRKNIFNKTSAKSVICVPFRIAHIIIGTLLLLNNESSFVFTEEDLSLIEKFSVVVSPFLHCTQEIEHFFMSPIPKNVLLNKYSNFGLLGKSDKFIDLLKLIDAAAKTDVRILLEGQSGTGKELIASAIHKLSSRSQNRYIAIDCGAIQPNLVESELFGHIKGAFTGALCDRKGLFEEANGGTLFMDEINNIPLDMQSKLLRVLQDEVIRPVGSNQTCNVNVRIIAASSLSLKTLVQENKFREDLYYRLNVYPIYVPSLNERVEDIPLLVEHFLKIFSESQKKEIDKFHEEIIDYFKLRQWKGNIRELENFIERLVTLTTKGQRIIDRKMLPLEYLKELNKIKKAQESFAIIKSLSEYLSDYEEQLLRSTLIKCNWNQSKAASILKISEHAVRYKMAKFKIEKDSPASVKYERIESLS